MMKRENVLTFELTFLRRVNAAASFTHLCGRCLLPDKRNNYNVTRSYNYGRHEEQANCDQGDVHLLASSQNHGMIILA